MFYFAWVDSGETTFGVEHQVVDESIYGFRIEHAEGEIPRLWLEVINPKVGLLSPDRERWAWLSWENPETEMVEPLFHGRLSGIPDRINDELARLLLVARPSDYEEQKAALAEMLKTFPEYDPVWFDADALDNPDNVLEGRAALWHVGRTDKAVSVSGILSGEDGTVGFATVYEINLAVGDEPIREVSVEARVGWKQTARGRVDLRHDLFGAFYVAGSPHGLVTSYTGDGLENTFWRTNDPIGGGWRFYNVNLVRLSGDGITPEYIEVEILPRSEDDGDVGDDNLLPSLGRSNAAYDTVNPLDRVRFYNWVFAVESFVVSYEAERERSEVIRFTLKADVQDLMSDSLDARVETINFNSSSVGLLVDNGFRPIGDLSRRAYFNTDRGKFSLQWLMCYARSRLLMAARAVDVTVEIPFSVGVGLSCRKSGFVESDKLPGGQAAGKITSYALICDGDSGELSAYATLSCAVGKGNELPAVSAGVPVWAEDDEASGYVVAGQYQQYAGREVQALAGELKFVDFHVEPVDDDVDFSRMTPGRVIAGARAAQLGTFTALPLAGDTVSVGVVTYTWTADPAAAYDLLIGSNLFECVLALASAINLSDGGEGFLWGPGTEGHADVTANNTDLGDDQIRVKARVPGTAGNAIAVAASGAAFSWAAATLAGGQPAPAGLRVLGGEAEQEAALNAGPFQDRQSAINAVNDVYTQVELELVPVVGGPFETDYGEVTVADLIIPKLIDLEEGGSV